ncbi:sensor histidine kinase [Aquipuribacter nitratireducens]|uniref:sensor histidine kinase n=1 Tax=Aquipuribacter nitratireducens TaxID=650104 RepID=UPI0036720AB9
MSAGPRAAGPALRLVRRAAVVALLATAAVVASPFLAFAVRAPSLHIMLETANAVVALLVLYLVYGRFVQHGRLQELLLVLALGVVAVANLVLTAVPDALTPGRGEELAYWVPLCLRLLGTLLLAAAAWTPVRARVDARTAAAVSVGVVLVVVVVAVVGRLVTDTLPPAVDPAAAGDASRPALVAHPVVLVVQLLGAALYGLAAVAFARQSDRTDDALLRWVAVGCVLAGAARVHYFLFPSLYSEFVYTGDVLRLGSYLCMLVGAAREITGYWQARARSAVLEDRRRLARDLHDGVIQELSYIRAQSHRLTAEPGDEVAVARIAAAAERAVGESRRALAALRREDDDPVPVVLRQTLDELAGRYDVSVSACLDPASHADAPMTEALVRITTEAVGNAVRHGGATRIEARLDSVPLRLTVRDDGCGFDPGSPGRPGAYGLRSMRERAEGIGAVLAVESEQGKGTTVRVSWV